MGENQAFIARHDNNGTNGRGPRAATVSAIARHARRRLMYLPGGGQAFADSEAHKQSASTRAKRPHLVARNRRRGVLS